MKKVINNKVSVTLIRQKQRFVDFAHKKLLFYTAGCLHLLVLFEIVAWTENIFPKLLERTFHENDVRMIFYDTNLCFSKSVLQRFELKHFFTTLGGL